MKRPFLVAADYGVFWAYIWAESREAIESRFDGEVVDELPDWLIDRDLNRRLETFDIEDPPDWLPRR